MTEAQRQALRDAITRNVEAGAAYFPTPRLLSVVAEPDTDRGVAGDGVRLATVLAFSPRR